MNYKDTLRPDGFYSTDSSRMESSSTLVETDLPLRWVGGKRRLLPHIRKYIETVSGRYCEPFFGGGAIFFGILPERAVISDLNKELIGTLVAIRDEPTRVHRLYMRHRAQHSCEYYNYVRDMHPKTLPGLAARMIYLNRACFNGVYRVNKSNKFNVPIGDRDPQPIPPSRFEAWSKSLSRAEIIANDFEAVVNCAVRGDLIYADPPYVTRHANGSFLRYNEKVFSWDDQVRLFEVLRAAKQRGVKIVITNADHPCIRSLYGRHFNIDTLNRPSNLAASPSNRGLVTEAVIYG